MGNSGFPLSCDGYFKEPLELHKVSQGSDRILKGNSGLLLRCSREKGPQLTLRGESCGFSQVAMGNLGFILSFNGTSGNLSCCHREVKSSFELRGEA